MLDTKRLLDQFLQPQNASPPAAQPDDGQGGGAPAQGAGGLLGGSLGSSLGNSLGGIGGGAVAGGLAGLLMGSKKGRKFAGNAAKFGGMAVLGALAYRAYQGYQAGKAPAGQPQAGPEPQTLESMPALEAPAGTPFNPTSEADQQSLALSLMRAMIAAAKADGHVDAAEQANIFAQMDELNLSTDEKAFVLDELRRPLDVDAVASGARSPEEAAEIYTASLLAIDVDNAAERGYLAMLAARLKLDDKLVEHLHATVESATKSSEDAVG